MKSRGIKICPVRPHESMDLRVYSHLAEQVRVLKRAVHFADEHRCEVDDLLGAVGKFHSQRMRTDALKRAHPMERMWAHRPIVAERWAAAVAPTAAAPIGCQFFEVQFGPCLDKPPLRARQVASHQFDRVEAEDADLRLVYAWKCGV